MRRIAPAWQFIVVLGCLFTHVAKGQAAESKSETPPAPRLTTKLDCLDTSSELAMAQLGADGKVRGLPKDHVGPMQLLAPGSLRFNTVAAAVRSLQDLGGRMAIAATDVSGKRVFVPVSLESNLSCSPLPAKGDCAPPRQHVPLIGAFGIVGPADQKTAPAAAESMLIQIDLFDENARVRATGHKKPIQVPLSALDGALRDLLAKRKVAVTFYVNATASTSWQSLVTALAITHCRLREAADQGFDAVLLGSPAG